MAKRLVFAVFVGAFLGVSWCASIPSDFSDAPLNKRFWYKPQPIKPKPTKFDVVLLLDSTKPGFHMASHFATRLLDYFSVFPAKTRVAVASFNKSVNLAFDFKKFVNKECVEKNIKKISFVGGSSDTGNALEYVRTDLIHDIAAGARNDAKKVIFLFTTGILDEGLNPRIPAAKLREKGVIIFVVRLRFGYHHGYRHGYGHNNRYQHGSNDWRITRLLRSLATGRNYVLSTSSHTSLDRVASYLNIERSQRCYTYADEPVLDECGRRCKCVHGKLVECCRLRKEFLDMSIADRRRYVAVVKKASTHPAYKERYDKLLTLHRDIFFSRIHELDYFLPWHRWFILQYENLLREIDCRITVPYWDWSLSGADPLASDVWNTGPHGLGGDGNGTLGCVDTGPFRAEVWSLPQSAGGGCLTRGFRFRTPDAVAVKELITNTLNPSDFEPFEFMLRLEFHDLVHCVIDGTMCTIDSASAPEFFLHHGFVDKIWWDWQTQGVNHTFNEYFVTQTALMPSTPYTSRDFLDLKDQPGCVCAEWVPARSKVLAALQGASSHRLSSIKRLPMPEMPESAKKLFKITDEEMERLHKLMEKMQPRETIKSSSLHGKDRAYGFKTADIKNKEHSHAA